MAAKASNTINGKAFEYACLCAVKERLLHHERPVSVAQTPAFMTAKNAFESLDHHKQRKYLMAAETGLRMITGLEPCLINGDGVLTLEISPDAVAIGSNGDVRDLLCIRGDKWQIGLSCKHNHSALKHPRITEGKDFGTDWVGIPCSQIFMDEITPVIDPLMEYKRLNTPWRNIPGKIDRFYVPILTAYLNEIIRMCDRDASVPSRLLSYFFGSHDFYKVIMGENQETTTVEGFNMHGSLCKKCGKINPITNISKIDMPTRLIDASFGKDRKEAVSKTTIILTFDGGWSVSMRLHNKDTIARPTSLAWDINLIGLPPKTYVNTRSWYEE